jgi:hypothetical protein
MSLVALIYRGQAEMRKISQFPDARGIAAEEPQQTAFPDGRRQLRARPGAKERHRFCPHGARASPGSRREGGSAGLGRQRGPRRGKSGALTNHVLRALGHPGARGAPRSRRGRRRCAVAVDLSLRHADRIQLHRGHVPTLPQRRHELLLSWVHHILVGTTPNHPASHGFASAPARWQRGP